MGVKKPIEVVGIHALQSQDAFGAALGQLEKDVSPGGRVGIEALG